MAREPVPTWYFVLVVVRLGHRFLLVQEQKHGQDWYLPAGRVEPGETLLSAARRETLEEAGIPVVIEGLVRVEHSPTPQGTARVRVIFVARPLDDRALKSTPDEHSLRADWYALDELGQLSLRDDEVSEIFTYLAAGGQIFPLSLLAEEGAPYLLPPGA